MCVKLVIHDVTCSFRLFSFTAQNLVSRGRPIFGSFCKPLRNVVTETFAEPAANWEVSSNRILTGRPSGSYINVKLVIHYLMLLEFCNKNITVVFTTSTNNGGLQGVFDFFDL